MIKSKEQTCREAGTQSDRVCPADSLAAEEIILGSLLVNQAMGKKLVELNEI